MLSSVQRPPKPLRRASGRPCVVRETLCPRPKRRPPAAAEADGCQRRPGKMARTQAFHIPRCKRIVRPSAPPGAASYQHGRAQQFVLPCRSLLTCIAQCSCLHCRSRYFYTERALDRSDAHRGRSSPRTRFVRLRALMGLPGLTSLRKARTRSASAGPALALPHCRAMPAPSKSVLARQRWSGHAHIRRTYLSPTFVDGDAAQHLIFTRTMSRGSAKLSPESSILHLLGCWTSAPSAASAAGLRSLGRAVSAPMSSAILLSERNINMPQRYVKAHPLTKSHQTSSNSSAHSPSTHDLRGRYRLYNSGRIILTRTDPKLPALSMRDEPHSEPSE